MAVPIFFWVPQTITNWVSSLSPQVLLKRPNTRTFRVWGLGSRVQGLYRDSAFRDYMGLIISWRCREYIRSIRIGRILG